MIEVTYISRDGKLSKDLLSSTLKKCERCHRILTGKKGRWCTFYCSRLGLKSLYKKRNKLKLNAQRRAQRKVIKGTRKWYKLALENLGDECVRCGTTQKLSVNHKIPRVVGGKDEMENYEIMCISCNAKEYGILVKKALKFYFEHHEN